MMNLSLSAPDAIAMLSLSMLIKDWPVSSSPPLCLSALLLQRLFIHLAVNFFCQCSLQRGSHCLVSLTLPPCRFPSSNPRRHHYPIPQPLRLIYHSRKGTIRSNRSNRRVLLLENVGKGGVSQMRSGYHALEDYGRHYTIVMLFLL